jgi:glucosamine-6-phosphate deaminase
MMSITIVENESVFDLTASQRVIRQILLKPDSVIGLSTGRTTKNMHRKIVEQYHRTPFDVSHVTFFGLDEVMNVPRTYAGACYTMLKTELIDDLGIDNAHFLMLPTMSSDWEKDCKTFVDSIEARGGIDLLILGLGENGHLGFNQPGTPFESVAWTTRMNDELEARIRQETQTPLSISLGGVTLGIKDIMHARKIVLVAKGAHKADMVRSMLYGPVSRAVPASVLQLHPQCEFLLDAAAAKFVKR